MSRRALIGGTLAVLAAVVVLVVAGCGDSESTAATTAPAAGGPLEGSWELTRYAVSGAMNSPPADVSIDAEFADGHVTGQSGVNAYHGTYTATAAGGLTMGPVASTQMAGPPDAMAAETAYLAALEQARTYAADSGTLTLRGAGGGALLEYTRSEPSIVGSWEVTGYNNGREAVVSVAPGSAITADFGAGAVAGSAGVNRYTATYETSAGSGGATVISIAPPTTTRMAGPPALMTQEQEYLRALESAATFTIRGKVLELRDGEDAIAVTLAGS